MQHYLKIAVLLKIINHYELFSRWYFNWVIKIQIGIKTRIIPISPH